MKIVGVMDIEIDRIEFPTRWRRYIDREKVEVLKKDIAAHGLINPIMVQEMKGGAYRLIAGYRRYTACKELGMKTIPATVITEAKEDEVLSLVVRENEIRENFSPVDVARLVWDLKDMGKTVEEIASLTAKNPQEVQDYIAIHENLCEEAKDLVARAPDADFQTVLLLSKIDDKRAQIGYAKMLANGASGWNVKQQILSYEIPRMYSTHVISQPQLQETLSQAQPQPQPQVQAQPQAQTVQEPKISPETHPTPEEMGKPGIWVTTEFGEKFFVPEEPGHTTPFKRPIVIPPELNTSDAVRKELAYIQSFPKVDRELQYALLSKLIELQAAEAKKHAEVQKPEEKPELVQEKLQVPEQKPVEAQAEEKMEILFKFYNREKYDAVKRFFMKPDGTMDSNLLYDIVEEKLAEQA
jgi:ParB/RepB/Spo0J family partition protein